MNNEESEMESQELPDIQAVNRPRKRLYSDEGKNSSSTSPLLKQRPSSGGQEGKNLPAPPPPSDPRGKGVGRNPSTSPKDLGEGVKGGSSVSAKDTRSAVSNRSGQKPNFNRISPPQKKTSNR